MKKNDISDKIIFISNTLGSFLLGFYFASFKSIIGYLLSVYCVLNLLCFVAAITHYGVEKEIQQNELRKMKSKENDKK